MSWRDDPETSPYWIEFADRVLATHPEWEPYVLGPLKGHDIYDESDERFFIEIPSEHPTIREPLTIELADREPSGQIDTYWNGYFEHNFCGSDKSLYQEQIDHMIARVEAWTSDDYIFRLYTEPRGRRKVRGPVRCADGVRVSTEEMPFVQWSWRGTHDRVHKDVL